MLIQANAKSIPLPDESVRCVVTSPPYWGLRDYGIDGQLGLEPTPAEYVVNLVQVFREVRRVLTRDGTVWLNLGDSYASSGGFRDYGSHDNYVGRGPNGGQRPAPAGMTKVKDLVGIPWRVAFALQEDGWWLRSDIIWSKPNPMPESVTDRPTKSHEYVFLLAKSEKYYFDQDAVRESGVLPPHERDRASNFKKVGSQDDAYGSHDKGAPVILCDGTRNIRTVWTIPTQPYSGAHFATFPQELAERCIKAGSAKGDTVLDPFCGSGTTVKVAKRLGRKGIGLDINPEYLELAEYRTASLKPPTENQPGLFF